MAIWPSHHPRYFVRDRRKRSWEEISEEKAVGLLNEKELAKQTYDEMTKDAAAYAEGLKYDEGKIRFDLIPPYPLVLTAEVYTIGAKKYADRNWEKGIKWCRIFRALLSHAWKWFMGEQRDPKDGQHHLASVVWCAFALMEYEHTHPEMDDRPVSPSHAEGLKVANR